MSANKQYIFFYLEQISLACKQNDLAKNIEFLISSLFTRRLIKPWDSCFDCSVKRYWYFLLRKSERFLLTIYCYLHCIVNLDDGKNAMKLQIGF